MSNKKENKFLERMKLIVDLISQTFGSRCEVVLHDFKDIDHSIIKIANGQVSGRKIGGMMSEYGLEGIGRNSQENLFVNYPSQGKDRRKLKSSTIVFRDKKDLPFAAMCINFDVTDIHSFTRVLDNIFGIKDDLKWDEPVERFNSDLDTIVTSVINDVVSTTGKSIQAMNKDNRMMVVNELKDRGIFSLKNSVKIIANELGVSMDAIYNYLREINKNIPEKKE